jgi:uncharacterized protein YggE
MRKLLVIAAAFALAAAAAACGGGDGEEEEPGIRTEQGLSVAAAAQAGERAEDRAAAGAADAEAPPDYLAPEIAASQIVAEAAVGSLEGLTVSGYAMASIAADSAILELYFTTGATEIPVPGTDEGSEKGSTSTQASAAISEEDLQPVIDAIVAQGVDRDDIELLGGAYYDVAYGSATLRVRVRNLGNLGKIIQAANDAAADLTDIFLTGSSVSYTVSDCAALERAALRAAKEDADARASALADALGVARGPVVGAANYAYSPFGGTACETSYAVPYPIGGVRYAEGQASEVQLYATVTVTYEMQ